MAKRKVSKSKSAKHAVKAAAKLPTKAGKKAKSSAGSQNSAAKAAAEVNGTPVVAEPVAAANGQVVSATERQRFLPLGGELKSLYARYYNCSTFDDHDKAFYFVLDVGGINRARQLLTHVEEVLAELEEFQG